MALITCPECGHSVSDQAIACPNCGYPISKLIPGNTESTEQYETKHDEPVTKSAETVEPESPKKKNILLYILVFIVVLFLLLSYIVGSRKTSSAESTDSTAVAASGLPSNTAEAMELIKKQHPNLKFTASGMGYEILKEGSGTSPKADGEAIFSYKITNLRGETVDEGTDFKSSLSNLIKGFSEGLQMMKPGGKAIFYIPSELAYDNLQDEKFPAGFLIANIELKDNPSSEFIQGGKTYTGVEIKDNAGFEGNEHSETTYVIECFNDGTMTWYSKTIFHNGYERKYQGEWKKNSGSKFDNSYTWYEFWGDTYDLHMNKHHEMIGFVDEQGRLYTMFSVEDPVMAIHNNKSVCQLREK